MLKFLGVPVYYNNYLLLFAALSTCTEQSCDGTAAFICKDGSCLKTADHSVEENLGRK